MATVESVNWRTSRGMIVACDTMLSASRKKATSAALTAKFQR